MIPSAAGFKLTSDRGFKYYNQTSQNSNFKIDTNGNLDLKDNDIDNIGSVNTNALNTGELLTEKGPAKAEHASDFAEVQSIIDEGDPRDRDVRITLPSQTTITPDPANLPVQLGQNVEVDGQGAVIDMSGVGKRLFEHDRSAANVDPDNRDLASTLRNIRVTGDETAGSQFLLGSNVPHIHLDRVWIQGLDDAIVLQDGCHFSVLNHVWVKSCSGDGIVLKEGPDGSKPNGVRLIGTSTLKCNRGVVVRQCAGTTLIGNSEDNESWNVLTDGVSGFDMSGNFEGGGASLDRDGDGTADPASIGISPDSDVHATSRGVNIHGCHINIPSDRTAIVSDDTEGLKISSCRLRGQSNSTAFELSTLSDGVQFNSSNDYKGVSTVVTEIVGESRISRPRKINDGVWNTEDFGGLEHILSFANEYGIGIEQSMTIEIAGDISRPGGIRGADLPRGTVIRGVGKRTVTVTGDANAAIELNRPQQRAENFILDGSGSNGIGHGLYLSGVETTGENIRVIGSNYDGVRVNEDNCTLIQAEVESANVSNKDIRVNGENCRVVGCDGAIVDNSTSGAATAANTDSL